MSLTKKLIGRDDKAKPARQEKVGAKASGAGLGVAQVDLRNILTEKSVSLSEAGVAVFRVPADVNKYQIAQAVFDKYGAAVLDVRTVRMRPKRRRRGHTTGQTANWKKAYVKVEDPSKIGIAP